MRTTEPIALTPEERATLDEWARSRQLPYRKVMRARIITMAADGAFSQNIARELGISRPTVQLWRERFMDIRIPGLEKDAPRPGRKPQLSDAKVRAIVEATLHTKPPNATHWSTRDMAATQRVSQSAVQRIWTRHNLKPHLTDTFKLSRDKHFLDDRGQSTKLCIDKGCALLV